MSATLEQDSLLLDYASGALPEGPALAVATQLALDPEARARYRALEAAGGMLFDQLEPESVSATLLTDTLTRLDDTDGLLTVPVPMPDAQTRRVLPAPLWRYVPESLDRLAWTRWGKNVQEAVLPLGNRDHRAVILRIQPGHAVPHHTHGGVEYTVVLSGGFRDEGGHYGRGDIQICDGSVRHQPVADMGEECICLAVLSAPIKVSGLLGTLVNPFLKF